LRHGKVAEIPIVVALVLLIAPFVAGAQPAGRVYRIGMLETRSIILNAANIDAFRQGMRELGYHEGQNLEIVYRSSDGRDDRFLEMADELIRLQVDLILTRGTPASLAAKKATRTIPVVLAAVGDPIGTGLVASLGRPGGNIAGLFNMGNPVLQIQWKEVERSTRVLGVKPQLLDVRRPEDLPRAFEAAAKERAEALIVALDGLTQANLRPIAELAAKHRLPSIYGTREYADYGGLITYGPSDPYLYHRPATFVDKIFKGTKPAELAIEQPTKFELVINLKTAKALGLTIPQSLLLRADQVVE
jgi:putative tryptophan/tyrosine transport system substrate-binding protein